MKSVMALIAAALFSISTFATTVDTSKSTFKWKADKKVGDGHWGNVSLKSATAKIEGDKIVSGEFVIDIASMTVDNLEGEWKTKFLGHVKGDDFFAVDKYPTATLKIDKQVGKGEVEGTLTIKGKEQPVKVRFTKGKDNYKGKLTFDRTKYGIVYGAGNIFKELTADKIIKNDVTIEFDVAVTK